MGPRPWWTRHSIPIQTSEAGDLQRAPGLTGIGSIVFRDEERLLSECNMPADVFYARHIAPTKGRWSCVSAADGAVGGLRADFSTAWVIVFPKTGC